MQRDNTTNPKLVIKPHAMSRLTSDPINVAVTKPTTSVIAK